MDSSFIEWVFKAVAGNVGAIIGISVLLATVAILSRLQRNMLDGLFKKAKGLTDHTHESSVKKSISCDKDINIELSRMLVGAKASRVGLFLFHNGSIFTTNSPIWKVSATHEICEPGVTQEFHKVQDVKASLLTPLMSPMFTGDDSEGVKNITPDRCPLTGEMCGRSTCIYRVTPEAIKSSFTQTFLINRGTRFAILAPLMDWDNNIVGFVFTEYCHDGFMPEDDLLKTTHLICRATSRIYQLISDLTPDFIVEQKATAKLRDKIAFWKKS